MTTIGTGPIRLGERLGSLDVLRGVAVCGILLMNIPYMGMLGDTGRPPMPAVANPDWIAHSVQNVLFAGSMRGLFTLLFGAGMLIMLRRADEIGGEGSVQAFLTRCFALVLLGVAQFAIFLWPGEILFNYGLCGLILLAFRKATVRVLWTAAIAVLVTMTIAFAAPNIERAEALRAPPAAAAAKAEGKTLTPQQEAALAMRARAEASVRPPAEKLEAERAQRTRFPGVLVWSTKFWVDFNLTPMGFVFLLESLGFMLIGMALYRTGVLDGGRSLAFYGALAAGGYGVGLAIRGVLEFAYWTTGFEPNPEQLVWRGFLFEASRLPVTIGLLGLVMVLYKTGALGRLAGGIQAIGRMALTNYTGQSIITSILFYGFGMVGRFGFAQLMGICVLVWIVQGVFSVLWLRRYAMGPLEWLLRCVTYGAWRPLERDPGRAAAVPRAAPAE